MSTKTRTSNSVAKPCVDLAAIFQNPLLEDDAAPATAAGRRELSLLREAAGRACADCPMMQRCLYTAVVEHDVAGFVAGTTAAQRSRIRGLLNVHVEPENLDSFAGVTAPNRQIDPLEVARLRAANPDESMETLAERLGCSLSTVKRHLRKVRNGAVRPTRATVRPSLEQVLHATSLVVGDRQRQLVAA